MFQKLTKLEEERQDLQNTHNLFVSSAKELFFYNKSQKSQSLLTLKAKCQLLKTEINQKKLKIDFQKSELIKMKERFSNPKASQIHKRVIELMKEYQENISKLEELNRNNQNAINSLKTRLIKRRKRNLKLLYDLTSKYSVYPKYSIFNELEYTEKEYFQNVSLENFLKNSQLIDIKGSHHDQMPLKTNFSVKNFDNFAETHKQIIVEAVSELTRFLILLKRLFGVDDGICFSFCNTSIEANTHNLMAKLQIYQTKAPIEKFLTLLFISVFRVQETLGYSVKSFEGCKNMDTFVSFLNSSSVLNLQSTDNKLIHIIREAINLKNKEESDLEYIEEASDDSFEIIQ